MSAYNQVAPRAGAWIEAAPTSVLALATASLPVRERGLKRNTEQAPTHKTTSLPVRERGLKRRLSLHDFVNLGRSPCGSVD